MISLCFRLKDLGLEPSHFGKEIRWPESRLEVFASTQIMCSMRRVREGIVIWVGEDHDPFPDADEIGKVYGDFDEFEGIVVFVPNEMGRTVEVVRTAAGSCPIYVAALQDGLTVSWRFEEVVAAVPNPRPHVDACRLYLQDGPCLIREQVIDGVSMLWPGEAVSWGGGDLDFRPVNVPRIVQESTFSDDALATGEFIRLVADAMRRNLQRAAVPMIELSGGLDSACVALAAKEVGVDLFSYGLIHDGAMGRQQRARRAELIALIGTSDFEFPSYRNLPLAGLAVAECAVTPFDDNHRLPCVYAVDNHAVQGTDLILTGIGGDELAMDNTFKRRDWELPGDICSSSLVAATARADMFMRRGIWTKNPLLDRAVVDFCRALPKRMKEGRLFNLLALARAGLSDGFLFPRYTEHYGNGMQTEAALFDFDSALAESVLHDFRVVDVSPLLAKARKASYGGFSYALIMDLFNLLKLDLILKQYVR